MGTFRDLTAYKKAFSLAMEIFQITKKFPDEEKFGLTAQIRRSSRAVCSSIGEGYRKRQYPAHFVSKVSDADMENTETQVWLDFALACNYISDETYKSRIENSEEVGS
jgi:four helix bundle protein